MRKFFLGILISLGIIIVLAYKFDYEKFYELWSKINYILVLPALVTQILGVIFFSWRWYYLVEKEVSIKHSLSSSFIGYGANMILPARGGDIFRIFYCRAESEMRSMTLLSKLFLEKIIDFVLIIILGMGTFLLLGLKTGRAEAGTILTLSGIIFSGIIVTIYILRFQNDTLRKFLTKITSILKKEEFYLTHLDIHVMELGEFLKIKNLILPLILSSFMWGCYVTTYFIARYMLSIDLSITEIGFILFCGGMSLAIPSAPSGLGVFHASIISAFLIIGKDSNAGLVYATVLHLISFFALTSTGLIFYLFWVYKRRNSGRPLVFKRNMEEPINE